jgi:hypothetical protein
MLAQLKALEKVYDRILDEKCELCGTEQEDTYHIVFICTCAHYKIYRAKYIIGDLLRKNNTTALTKNNYTKMFNTLCEENSLNVYQCFSCALNKRSIY